MAQNGDEEVYKLEEVVVTATRDMKVLDTPASISVITAKELEEQGITNIGDAIVTDLVVSTYVLNFSYRGAGLFLNSLASVTVDDEDRRVLDKTYTSPKSVYNDD